MVGTQHKDRDTYVKHKPVKRPPKHGKGDPKYVVGERFDYFEQFAKSPWAYEEIISYGTKDNQFHYKLERHIYPGAIGRTDLGGVTVPQNADLTKSWKNQYTEDVINQMIENKTLVRDDDSWKFQTDQTVEADVRKLLAPPDPVDQEYSVWPQNPEIVVPEEHKCFYDFDQERRRLVGPGLKFLTDDERQKFLEALRVKYGTEPFTNGEALAFAKDFHGADVVARYKDVKTFNKGVVSLLNVSPLVETVVDPEFKSAATAGARRQLARWKFKEVVLPDIDSLDLQIPADFKDFVTPPPER